MKVCTWNAVEADGLTVTIIATGRTVEEAARTAKIAGVTPLTVTDTRKIQFHLRVKGLPHGAQILHGPLVVLGK